MNKTVSWTGGTDEEYESQHFGFGLQQLKISVRQMIEEKITSGIKSMETHLKDSLDLNDTDKATLTRSCDKLIRMYCERSGPSLENIDSELEKIFKIPKNVLLPEDDPQIHEVTDEEYKRLVAEAASLRKQVERGALMEALLTAEEDEINSVENACELARQDMETIDYIKNCVESNDMQAIMKKTQFLCSLKPVLKELSDKLFEL